MEPRTDFLLIIPAYCEERRLPPFLRELVEALADAPYTTTIRIVDDDSPGESQCLLQQQLPETVAQDRVHIEPMVTLPRHCGKGYAIQRGWGVGDEATWLAFVDADGAIPADDVRRLFDLAWSHSAQERCYCAVRRPEAQHPVQRLPGRWLGGALFRSLVSGLFRLPIRDTQCGCKVVSASAWSAIRDKVREDGFCFDVELLTRLHRRHVAITPIPVAWREIPGGHFRLIIDGLGTTLRLVLLKRRLG